MSQEQDPALIAHLAKKGIDDKMVMGHPAGLFILFFTEMWERFSYYGMRALLTVFLITEIAAGGWEWDNADAMQLYAWYTGLVYLTPLLGGIIADKFTGFRKAILLGALVMTLGHLSMAFEGINPYFFYAGLVLMILGNGLFKPNISSMVGNLYPDSSSKKDAGYTIFYMGINAGAFLGMLLCGYIGEKVGWHYGFGLAGVFMLFGMLQFYFGTKIFGDIGAKPEKHTKEELEKIAEESDEEVLAPNVVRDRLVVVGVLMVASIFFFFAFEQAGGSMTVFAKDYTQRILEGSTGTIFKWVDAILTIFPIIIVTWVLYGLGKKIYKAYPLTIIFTAISFVLIWILGVWKVYREFSLEQTEVTVSWFQILNSFFIITLASSFSKLWEKVWNPSGPVKFAMGLALVGVGFVVLSLGANSIPQGATSASVSMIWLILAYFFHTTGELCLSPVGLSYVSKLSPKRLAGLLFGLWFTASAIANFIAGMTGSYIDKISETYSMSTFFLIIAAIPMGAAVILLLLNPKLKKMMHGIN
ncbi:peptide MFS transporter [Oceanihabitans sediminis]|uniref:MFS transporter n=1 Tax=Oceanihabitans sediminis TaxID=1812012 RepID=A0A368P813_9FLAO|nr:peptide MFS transporter [Oceanihabitans sediminis]MDX1278188.1 peptide MFS transporter [Oceanihabitans sediminis]MDX1773931.1 peptide MFS transporter [Oceanihabitans sediminis]RBP32043.1 POT family proton-dependent oligopeptide transporter [Oceanihabitans sediminis]RCU58698.1 MFS transporter [Oceanihabitans sediminis]